MRWYYKFSPALAFPQGQSGAGSQRRASVSSAKSNRRPCARAERDHLPRRYSCCWVGPRVPDAPPCPRRHAQNRGIRCHGRPRPGMIPLEPRDPPSDAQLHLVGGRDLADAKPAQDSNHRDRKSTRLNSSHRCISYAVFCLKKKIIIFHFSCTQYLHICNITCKQYLHCTYVITFSVQV